MPEVCRCGNVLRETSVRINVWPCRCEEPGDKCHAVPTQGIPDWIPREQVEERRKAGLPEATPIERGSALKWV